MNGRALIVLALLALFFGCLGIGESQTTSVTPFEGKTGFAAGTANMQSAPSPSLPSNLVDQTGRMVIKQGSINLEVAQGTLEAKVAEFKQLVAAEGGVVYDSRYYESSGVKSYSITVKIPPTSFESFPDKIKRLGKLKSFDTSTQDVTNQWTDLDIRIKNLVIERDMLQALFNKTNNVSEILQIENELTRVQNDIEYNTAQKIQLERQVELATLDVTIQEEAPVLDQTLIMPLSGLLSVFLGGLAVGLTILFGAAGFLIPAAIALLVLYGIYKLYRKIRPAQKKK